MKIDYYQVDAFTDKVFQGNPAGVCPLDEWLPDDIMQSIAAKSNLADTAFFKKQGDSYGLRWFTPTLEVDLCGHATLASAFVISSVLNNSDEPVIFDTEQAGRLVVEKMGSRLVMDLPSRAPEAVEVPELVADGLGCQPAEVLGSRDYLAIFDHADDVANLAPDLAKLACIDRFGVIATAPGKGDVDFVSRFFAPGSGIPEDPVTGSAHCTLIPYWARRLGKRELLTRQISSRGGTLFCEDKGDRVSVGGTAALYLSGTIEL